MRPSLPSLLLLAVLASAAFPQAQENSSSEQGPSLHSKALRLRAGSGLQPQGQGLVALGADYKARLDSTGLWFVPALGERAAQLYPFSFQLESIARGTQVVLENPPAIEPVQQGLTAVYGRGLGIEEQYEARPEGLEQSFVFASKPAGSGDLVVQGRVRTELAASVQGNALRFTQPGLGGVQLSPVVAIDATGARQQGWMRMEGDQLLLGIPGAFVESATYPLVLDPLIGTEIDVETSTTIDDQECDAAFSQEHDAYLVAWRRVFSSTDVDVRAQRVSASGALVGSLTAINTVSGICTSVSVGYVPLSDRWLIAYTQSTGIFDDSDIYARAFSAVNGTLSDEVAIASSSSSESSVDLGSEATLVDNEVLATYNLAGFGIRAVQINVPSSGNPALFGSTLSVSSDADDSTPRISRSGGSLGRYLIVWQRLEVGTGFDLFGRLVDRNALALTSEAVLANASGAETSASVDGDGERWLVAWQDNTPSGNGDGNIFAASWHTKPGLFGSLVLDTSGGTKTVEANLSDDEVDPSVAYNGEACVVTWSDETGSHYDIRAAVVDLLSANLCGFAFNVASSSESELNSVVTAEWGDLSQSSNDDDVLMLWDETDTSTATGEIAAQLYATDTGTTGDLGGACGAGGKAWATCAAVGNANFELTVTGTAANATSFLLLGTEGVSMPCGSCTLHIDPTAAWVAATPTNAVGTGSLALAIPPNAALAGVNFLVQWGTPTLFGGGTCTTFGVDLSNGLTVVIQ